MRSGYFKVDATAEHGMLIFPGELVGATPVVELRRWLDHHGPDPIVYQQAPIRRRYPHHRDWSISVMAARKKKVEAAFDGTHLTAEGGAAMAASMQLDIEQAIADQAQIALEAMLAITPAALIKEFLTLKAHAESEGKRFAEYMKPTVDRMKLIQSSLHSRALAGDVNGFPTDEGTAYLSEIVSHKIDPEASYTSKETGRTSIGRDALLDWMLDYWDEYGSEGIQLNVSKAIVEKWMENTQTEENKDGVPPPGLKIDKFKQLNIRRT